MGPIVFMFFFLNAFGQYICFLFFLNSLRPPEKSINMVTQSSEPNSLLDSYMIFFIFFVALCYPAFSL